MAHKKSKQAILISVFVLIMFLILVKVLVGNHVQDMTDKRYEYAVSQFIDFRSYGPQENKFPSAAFFDPEGKKVTIETYKGGYVLLNFWATWCPACVKELPSLQKLSRTFAEKKYPVKVIALSLDREKTGADLVDFLIKYDIEPFALYHDREKTVSLSYPIGGMPTTFLVDPNGYIRYEFLGEADWMNYALIDMLSENFENYATQQKLQNSP
ncbi:MAG: TlpA family protein disulfide reductase [Rhodospirillales bacterium]|nr:TlpA family protein disulfide reductase [Rhodospirillales bacterium]MCB9973579.1 TlpA family protein disulfide reductase [Rhodospirillales bacterium]MCB9979617.1 TlpA family protein disulfide reductase [Rhodospirillales bacterium]